jgi:hypothetical protein
LFGESHAPGDVTTPDRSEWTADDPDDRGAGAVGQPAD